MRLKLTAWSLLDYQLILTTMTQSDHKSSRLEEQNSRLKYDVCQLESEIRERCQNYMLRLGGKQNKKLTVCHRVISCQVSVKYEEEHVWDFDLKKSVDMGSSKRNLQYSVKNSSLCDSRISEPEQLHKLQEQIQFLKRLHQQQQKNRKSATTDGSTLKSLTLQSSTVSLRSDFESRIQEEHQKVRDMQAEIRKYQQRVYVYENIFSNIYELVVEEHGSNPAQEIKLGKYDKMEENLRALFTRIKSLKKTAKQSDKEKKQLMNQLRTINAKANNVFRKESEQKQTQAEGQIIDNQLSSCKVYVSSTKNFPAAQQMQLLGLRKELDFQDHSQDKDYHQSKETFIRTLRAEGITSNPNSPEREGPKNEQQPGDVATATTRSNRSQFLRDSMSTVTEQTNQQRVSISSLEDVFQKAQRRSCIDSGGQRKMIAE